MDPKKIEEKLAIETMGWDTVPILNGFAYFDKNDYFMYSIDQWHPLTSHDQMFQCVQKLHEQDFHINIDNYCGNYAWACQIGFNSNMPIVNKDLPLAIAEAIGRCQGWWEE